MAIIHHQYARVKRFFTTLSQFLHTHRFALFRLMPAGHSQLLIASLTNMGNSLSLRRISDSLLASMIGLLPLISLGDGNLLAQKVLLDYLRPMITINPETSEILVSREFSRFFFIFTSRSRSRAVSISLSLLEKE